MKAQPKEKECPTCLHMFKVQKLGQKTCWSVGCVSAYIVKKDREKKEKTNRKDLRELNRKNKKWQHKNTTPVFNRMRMLQEFEWFKVRGIAPHCISCGNSKTTDFCCGHFKTVAARGDLRYDPINTYLQCNFHCNSSKSGNVGEYRKGLLRRFGLKQAKAIIEHCEAAVPSNIQWTWEGIEQVRKDARKEIKRLESD